MKRTSCEATMSIDSHDVAERARLLSHQIYAEHLRNHPELLQVARDQIKRTVEAEADTIGECLWENGLQQPLENIISDMLRDDERGQLLRANSPSSLIVGVRDPALRRVIWRQAKAELT